MARSIIAVIVAYIAMFILVFIAFTCAYLIVGAETAFKPGSYEASSPWIGIAFLINFVVAIVGGLICTVIAKCGIATLGLAIVVFVLGILLAIPSVMKRQTNINMVRASGTSQLEAVQKAYWPVWVPFTFPFTGVIGVLIGGKLKRRA